MSAAAVYGAQMAKAFNPDQPRDDRGRFAGTGENLGFLAGAGAGLVNAPRLYRAVRDRLATPAVYNFKHFAVNRHALGRSSRAGLALLAAYGAVKVGGDVGSYVGRKIDEAFHMAG